MKGSEGLIMARAALCSRDAQVFLALGLLFGTFQGLLLLRVASFSPFADVEELKPQRLHPYCADARDEAFSRVSQGACWQDGHRWCSRSIKKRLEACHVSTDLVIP